MKTIPLHGAKAAGRVALVDDEDYELVSAYRWRAWEDKRPGRRTGGPYAVTKMQRKGCPVPVLMHTLITGRAWIDHENHDGLDNRRENLRPATVAQNAHNQRPRIGRTSAYKGVTWHRQSKKWQAAIKVGGRSIHLGLFASEVDAAAARDAASREHQGAYAYLNEPTESGDVR